MWLNFQIALEQVPHYIVVSKARTEMERDMVFIVLSIHCHQHERKRYVIWNPLFLSLLMCSARGFSKRWETPGNCQLMIIIKEIRCNQFLKSRNSLLSPITTLNRLSLSSHKFYGMHLIKSTLHNGIGQETIKHTDTHGLISTSISFQIDIFSLWETLKITDPAREPSPEILFGRLGKAWRCAHEAAREALGSRWVRLPCCSAEHGTVKGRQASKAGRPITCMTLDSDPTFIPSFTL